MYSAFAFGHHPITKPITKHRNEKKNVLYFFIPHPFCFFSSVKTISPFHFIIQNLFLLSFFISVFSFHFPDLCHHPRFLSIQNQSSLRNQICLRLLIGQLRWKICRFPPASPLCRCRRSGGGDGNPSAPARRRASTLNRTANIATC